MIDTDYIYRILLLYPQSRYDEIEEWYESQFPEAGPLLTSVGTKGGEDWYASCFIATSGDVDKWIEVFHNNLGPDVPLSFTSLPRANQRALLAGLQIAALANMGIYVDGCFNDEGEMCDYSAALAAVGVELHEPIEN